MKSMAFIMNIFFLTSNTVFLIQCFVQDYLGKNHILTSLIFGIILIINIVALEQYEKDSRRR